MVLVRCVNNQLMLLTLSLEKVLVALTKIIIWQKCLHLNEI